MVQSQDPIEGHSTRHQHPRGSRSQEEHLGRLLQAGLRVRVIDLDGALDQKERQGRTRLERFASIPD